MLATIGHKDLRQPTQSKVDKYPVLASIAKEAHGLIRHSTDKEHHNGGQSVGLRAFYSMCMAITNTDVQCSRSKDRNTTISRELPNEIVIINNMINTIY